MASIDNLDKIVSLFSQEPALGPSLSFSKFVLLYRLLLCLRERLSWQVLVGYAGPPELLPTPVTGFLLSALDLSTDIEDEMLIQAAWIRLRSIVWLSLGEDVQSIRASVDNMRSKELLEIFRLHGHRYSIGFQDKFPLPRRCLYPDCPSTSGVLALGDSIPCLLFTRDHGPQPLWSYKAECNTCRSVYYPAYNKFIDKTQHPPRPFRLYHAGIPKDIHVQKHVYVEASLGELITNSFVFAWVSAANSARIYNAQVSDEARQEIVQHGLFVKPVLTPETVWNTFLLLALLREHHQHNLKMVMDNDGDLDTRIDTVLRWRNERMVGTGQPNWNHVCDACCETRVNADGSAHYLRAIVIDGVAVGRPCCSVHNCKNRLQSTKHRFCEAHSDRNLVCSIDKCSNPVETGHLTCTTSAHRAFEKAAQDHHTALFQLTRRIEKQKLSHVDSSNSEVTSDKVHESLENTMPEDTAPETHEKSDRGNRLRALFCRARTHNEQLAVTPCGMVLGCMTMYGAEAIGGIPVFLRALFPTKKSLPNIIFYDNACSLLRHLKSPEEPDTYFEKCLFPVDVFHAKTKHSDKDIFCGQHCNPASFEELKTNEGWRFNSSAAEMVNAWFGGFQAITREMREDRYRFFLDEMIKLHNEWLIGDLERRKMYPYLLNRGELLTR